MANCPECSLPRKLHPVPDPAFEEGCFVELWKLPDGVASRAASTSRSSILRKGSDGRDWRGPSSSPSYGCRSLAMVAVGGPKITFEPAIWRCRKVCRRTAGCRWTRQCYRPTRSRSCEAARPKRSAAQSPSSYCVSTSTPTQSRWSPPVTLVRFAAKSASAIAASHRPSCDRSSANAHVGIAAVSFSCRAWVLRLISCEASFSFLSIRGHTLVGRRRCARRQRMRPTISPRRCSPTSLRGDRL